MSAVYWDFSMKTAKPFILRTNGNGYAEKHTIRDYFRAAQIAAPFLLTAAEFLCLFFQIWAAAQCANPSDFFISIRRRLTSEMLKLNSLAISRIFLPSRTNPVINFLCRQIIRGQVGMVFN